MGSSADSRGMLYATWHRIQSVDPNEVKDYKIFIHSFIEICIMCICVFKSFVWVNNET